MRLRAEQLTVRLNHRLAPLYLVYGDEPLLVQETADSIREAARAQGYHERECLTVDTGFEWNTLLAAAHSPSLFAAQRLLELRLGTAKPGDLGAKALMAYAARPAEDAILLVTGGKLDRTAQQSRWFAALDTAGVVVQLWPVEARQLPAWIERRMLARGLRPTAEATAWLAQRVEGNLLAAAQEIEKLHLLFGSGAITLEQLLAVVGDSARYSIYDLVDAALSGDTERVVRMVNGLRGEGVEAVLIAWVLHREIRLLSELAFETGAGLALEAALTRHTVREKRKPLLRRALQRLPVKACRGLLRDCARVDRLLKGVGDGSNAWDELLDLSLRLAGCEVWGGS